MGATRQRISSIALINPLSDFGINQFSHELAQALASNGIRVGFFTADDSSLPPPVGYTRHAVLGRMILNRDRPVEPKESDAFGTTRKDWLLDALSAGPPVSAAQPVRIVPPSLFRRTAVTLELAYYLKRRGYDAVWTQWPELDPYEPYFRRLCRTLGIHVIHSVHNVLPHEEQAANRALLQRVYNDSELLFVHSEEARQELHRHFPALTGKTQVMRHGLYTMYPRRPELRQVLRAVLGLAPNDVVVLCAGAIRPYKNIDAVLEAISVPGCENLKLVVSGVEAHFPDLVPGDPLRRTEELAHRFGVADRVRLIPRFLSVGEMAELFEAGDISATPYTSGYGSGMLLLGMTFGKYIVTTKIGGAEEYLSQYSRSILLEHSDAQHVAAGLAEAAHAIGLGTAAPPGRPPELEWKNIARMALERINSAFFR